jgi:predicted AAA+ superfamily ATPase
MNIDLLKQIVTEQSIRTIPDDFVQRTVYELVRPLKLNKEIIIITGIRRCGKSTLLQKIRSESQEKDYYLNFEDDRLINFTISDFQLLLEVFSELFGPQKTFYFDEIQNIPDWERFVRRLHDQGCKMYITGSNANMLSKELGTKLTGRYIALTMYPYSFYEYVNAKSPTLINKKVYVTEDIAIARKMFTNYFRIGGIPEFVRLTQTEYLHGLYEGVLYRDIITRYKLPQEKPIKELAFYLASHVGKEITFNSLRKIIGLSSAATVAEYCEYFENSFLCFLVNRYSHSLKKQIGYEKKQYFVDHALAGVIGFRTSEDKGRFLENIVFIELKRRGQDIYFHKEKNECDFIIKYKNKIVTAIQVCVTLESEEVKKREYAGLIEAMAAYGLHEGIILTEGPESKETIIVNGNKYTIHSITLWKWLLR